MEEIVSKRTESSKTYSLGGKKYRFEKMSNSIHYLDDDVWKEIDTTIGASDRPNWDWEVTKGNWTLLIKDDTSIAIGKDGNWIGFCFKGLAYFRPTTEDYEILATASSVVPIVTASKIRWEDIVPGVNFELVYTPDGLKENIEITQTARDWLTAHPPSDYGIPNNEAYLAGYFECDWTYAYPLEDQDGTPIDLDQDNDIQKHLLWRHPIKSTIASIMPIGFAESAESDVEDYRQEKVRHRFFKVGGKHYLLTGAKTSVLNTFPSGTITIDPTTYTNQPAAIDTWLSSYQTTTNYGSSTFLGVSSDSVTAYRTIIRFDITDLPSVATIDSASLYFWYFARASQNPVGRTVNAHKLTPGNDGSDWVELEATYNEYADGESWDTPGGDYEASSPTPGAGTCPASFGWFEISGMKALVDDGIDNESGIVDLLVKNNIESGSYYRMSLYSSNYTTDTSKCPKLIIDYTTPYDFTCRDFASIGNVTAGSEQVFEVDLDAEPGDVIGIFFDTGEIETSESAGSNVYFLAGDQTASGIQYYEVKTGYSISVEGVYDNLFDHNVAGPVSSNFISSDEVVYNITVTSTAPPITAGFISSSETFYQPSVSGPVAMNFIATAEATYQPTVVPASTVNVNFIPVSTATKQHYYEGSTDSGNSIYDGLWKGQVVTPTESFTATKVALQLYRAGSPGTLTVSIRAAEWDTGASPAGYYPTGADLCVGTVNADTFSTSLPGAWVGIEFSTSLQLIANAKYCIVARALDGDASNLVYWVTDSSGPTYTGGANFRGQDASPPYDDPAWDDYDTGFDQNFAIWGNTDILPPVVTVGTVTVESNFISSGESLYEPAVAGPVAANFIGSDEALYNPDILAGQLVALQFISSTETFYAPAVAGPVSTSFIDSLEALYQPTIVAGGWAEMNFIDTVEFMYYPEVIIEQFVTSNFISTAEALYQPSVMGSIEFNFISSTETFYSPTVTTANTVDLNFIDDGVLYNISVSIESTVNVGYIDSTETMYEPDVGTLGTVGMEFISSLEALYELTVINNQDVEFNFISDGAIYQPTTTTSTEIESNFIASVEALYEPTTTTTAPGITAGFIDSLEALYNPNVTYPLSITSNFISTTEAMYEPTVSFVTGGRLLDVSMWWRSNRVADLSFQPNRDVDFEFTRF